MCNADGGEEGGWMAMANLWVGGTVGNEWGAEEKKTD